MEANRNEVDPFGQELIEGSTIAEGIEHTTPSSSAPPIEGRVQLSDVQRRESKKAADRRYNEKRKRNDAELKRELQKLEADFGELESKKKKLKRERDQRKDLVDEENKKILSQYADTYAGENTGVPQAGVRASFFSSSTACLFVSQNRYSITCMPKSKSNYQ
ncbi:hypothetical protein OIU77_010057 [Salix suchowensis]|uniref:BZIP domain-containing protein n=1 Tax=Salix suchowensis TaxID=1278906 RepID=A0ABQ9A719_9ROSI|nr:hypothetical protein OIU78_015958 [Salix suchowensis]KAJ6328287.1 hypothetical protein OIU77_010057 [Salix suchowensis]